MFSELLAEFVEAVHSFPACNFFPLLVSAINHALESAPTQDTYLYAKSSMNSPDGLWLSLKLPCTLMHSVPDDIDCPALSLVRNLHVVHSSAGGFSAATTATPA